MTFFLLASSLIDGACTLDLASVGIHVMQSIALPGFIDPSVLDSSVLGLNTFDPSTFRLAALVQGHGATTADAASAHWGVLAQYFETDVFADTRGWWSDFVSSGKIWALIFGVVLGYLLRALTSYG